jgi:DNA-binding transcriptional MocR family regulator
MTLNLSLRRQADEPLYRQIAEQIRHRIVDMRLPAGTQLPTVRSLASELGVTRLTVQTAYSELHSGGWVEATVGRGTFVADVARSGRLLQSRENPLTPDVVIDDMIEIAHVHGVRSLANASPDSSLFPAQEFWNVLADLRDDASVLSEYGSIQGDTELRIELATGMVERGINVMPGDLLVTAGVTQALALITETLCRPGDGVLVEQPTYLSFLNVLHAHGVQAIGVPMDSGGIILDALERLVVQVRPRFLYTIPVHQNPTGVSLDRDRRQGLIEMAARYGFLIVEDDIYARISYDEPPPPALLADDDGEHVIYVSSFSKTFMPGLRVGFVAAPPTILRRLLDRRRATDLCGPPLLQRALAEFIRRDGVKRHLRRALPIYRERRDALLTALSTSMPAGVNWTRPMGGFCCWLTLPNLPIYDDLYSAALRQGWAFAPGSVFLAQPETTQAVRICFGQHSPAVLRAGVESLATLIRLRMEVSTNGDRRIPDWSPIV